MRKLLVLVFAGLVLQAQAGIVAEPWGVLWNGQAVGKVTLENELGMRLAYIDYGGTITAVEVPDRDGRRRNVMLSLPSIAAYEATSNRHAAVIGRYAGRIKGATFQLDGRSVKLVPNFRGLSLHGGPAGFEKRVWSRRDFADAASIGSVFQLVSEDGDQGFPGRLDVRMTYRLLRKSNEFRIEYAAVTSAPTVVNLTNHGFFNLAGAGTSGLASHAFRIDADRYAVTDAMRIPTGELASVAGTPLDFRAPASLAARLAHTSALLGQPAQFDHALLFSKPDGALAPVATIVDIDSGRTMEVWTSEPAAVLYSGNGFRGDEVGSEGVAYRRYDGFAFETQHLADSPNQPHFPSTVLRPGQTFTSTTAFRFSVAPPAAP